MKHDIIMKQPRPIIFTMHAYCPWLSMVKFVLMIIYFTASPIVLFCLLFSQIQGCEFFCLGPESHIKKVITVPPWILYKLPLLHLACMTLAFNQGYGMRVWTISRNASPNDV